MKLHKSKRGEAEQAIVYTMYVSFLMIFGIFIILAFTENMCTITENRASNLDYNSMASRILYSSECFAIEKSYEREGPHYYVEAATLDQSKITKDQLKKCIENPSGELDYVHGEYDIEVKSLDDDFSFREGKCDGDDWQRSEDILVLIEDEDENLHNAVATFCIEVHFEEAVYSEECNEKLK